MDRLVVNLSVIFTEVPLIERFALAKQAGFNHVEIQFPYELSISDIQQQLHEHNLTLCLINVPVGDLFTGGVGLAGAPHKEHEFSQALDLAIEYAVALNVKRVNILAGKQTDGIDYETCFNTFVSNLKIACERLSAHQIMPLFEMINGITMPNFLVQTISQAQHVIKAVACPELKMQFDCFHMAMMNENIEHQLTANISNIGHIQFADSPARHEPDTGSIDFKGFFNSINDVIKQNEYQGYIAAEYLPATSSLASFAWKTKYF